MSAWQEINRVMADADKLEQCARIYMERGNVTWAESVAWAIEQKQRYGEPTIPTPPPV